MIAAERQRQIEEEGWTAEHDAKHGPSTLIDGAICYAKKAESLAYRPTSVTFEEYQPGRVPSDWPWNPEWWKPSDDPIRNLTKAGALIAAEIDRLTAALDPEGDR
jgi:hypothetical protein